MKHLIVVHTAFLPEYTCLQLECYRLTLWWLWGSVIHKIIQHELCNYARITYNNDHCTRYICKTRHINPCLVLVQPRKTRLDMTETILTGTLRALLYRIDSVWYSFDIWKYADNVMIMQLIFHRPQYREDSFYCP